MDWASLQQKFNCRSRSILVFSLIVLTFVGWVNSGKTICVSTRDTRLLFSNSDTKNICKDVFLYVNGIKNKILIGSWKWENGIFENVYMKPDYKRKIVVDRDGDIWILNVNASDAGKYIIQCDNQKYVTEVELKFSEDLMECQNDATFMKKHSENSNKEALMLMQHHLEDVKKNCENSNKEALMQMRNHLEEVYKNCGGSNGMIICILVVTVLTLACVLAVILIIWRYPDRQYKNKNFEGKQTIPLLESDQISMKKIENLNREQTLLLEQNSQQLMKYFEHLMKEEMQPLQNINLEGLEKLGETIREKQTISIQEIRMLWTECFGNFKGEHKLQFQENCQQWMEHFENLKREQTVLLEQNFQQWMKYFECLMKEKIIPMLNNNLYGFKRFCENMKEEQSIFMPESEDPWLKRFGKLKWEEILELLYPHQREALKSYCHSLQNVLENTILKICLQSSKPLMKKKSGSMMDLQVEQSDFNQMRMKLLKIGRNKLTFEKIRELEDKRHGESCNFVTNRPVMEEGAQNNSSQALESGPVIDMNESKETSQKY